MAENGWRGNMARTIGRGAAALWNPDLRTPSLYGQFHLSRQKAHIFSLKLTCFIRTMGHFSCPSHALSYIVNPALRTLVICTLSVFIVTFM